MHTKGALQSSLGDFTQQGLVSHKNSTFSRASIVLQRRPSSDTMLEANHIILVVPNIGWSTTLSISLCSQGEKRNKAQLSTESMQRKQQVLGISACYHKDCETT